ncbi:MAG: glycosyltransferase [Symploca sp. SIO3E6]|nr:glycosyltransferase [Caldora sp. SIO3E6]
MPKVTVLMAVYNGERYLREAMDSILAQTFKDFEFLIINDGSTDSTREIICSYDDLRIRLIDNEQNLGLTRSLNKGWKLAEGEFIARQDADDVSEPERFTKQVAFLEAHSEVALLGSWFKNIDSQGNLIGEYDEPCDTTGIRWKILFYCPFIHGSVMFRKQTITEQIGFYNERFVYAQDYDLWWRITRHLQVANLDEYLMRLRTNSSSMTTNYGNIVNNEPLQIKLNHIRHLVGLQKATKWNNGVLLKAMASLWSNPPDEIKEIEIKQLNITIEEILKLHQDFCQYYQLSQKEVKQHYTHVCNHLSIQLLRLANYSFEKNKSKVGQTLIQSYLLNKHILLAKGYLRLTLKLFLGSRFVNTIRYIRNKTISQYVK